MSELKLTLLITLLNCIRVVPSSKLGHDKGYYQRRFSWFTPSLQKKWPDITSNLATPSVIHFSLTIQCHTQLTSVINKTTKIHISEQISLLGR